MTRVTVHRQLALAHFLLAVAASLVIYFFPAAGLWPLLLPAVPFAVRLLLDRPLFHERLLDGLLAIFLITAVIGYWTAYDATAAWLKLQLLLAGILLYYAISTQPESNLLILAVFWFTFGVFIAGYFLLTHDFEASPAKFLFINQMGLKWMSLRLPMNWHPIESPDAAAGIALITSVYGLNFLFPLDEKKPNQFIRLVVSLGFGLVLAAFLLATSRGAMVAVAFSVGIWLAWLGIRRTHLWERNIKRLFPVAVLLSIGLIALLLLLPRGIFSTSFLVGDSTIVNRSALIRDGISIMMDFPLVGGGLESFPGLYSQYMRVIPFFSLQNSHDMYVDVMVEQGMLGGLAFLTLYGIAIWRISSIMDHGLSRRRQILYGSVFISICIAMVHGLVDDYLYEGWGSALVFFPVGMSMLAFATQSIQELVPSGQPFPNESAEHLRNRHFQVNLRSLIVAVICLLLWFGLAGNKILAGSLANLGAVNMDKIELAGFPADQWVSVGQEPNLGSAKMLFERSLAYDPDNRLANHRLGLIAMSERDLYSASQFLEKAYQKDPSHRGIVKNLGYSYAWQGEMDKAAFFLEKISEAQSELEVYAWWWNTQGRPDLSAHASDLTAILKAKNFRTDNSLLMQ